MTAEFRLPATQPRMKIVLMRHGKPDFDFSRRISAVDFARIAHEYDTARLADTPPAAAISIARQCRAIVCSDLIRSPLSAQALGLEEIALTSPLFRESPLPYPDSGTVRLSLTAWAVLLRISWLLGYSRNAESFRAARQRAQEATHHLAGLAAEHGSVLLVGHGVMNRLLAKALRKQGWQETQAPGSKHWSFGVYEYPAGYR